MCIIIISIMAQKYDLNTLLIKETIKEQLKKIQNIFGLICV